MFFAKTSVSALKASQHFVRGYASHAGPQKAYKVVVVGGGSAGISVAAQIAKDPMFWAKNDIAIIDPSDVHYYQPLWTLVGGGVRPFDDSKKPMYSVIPAHCQWIQKKVTKIDAERNVVIANGTEIEYEYLVVAPGIQMDWGKIPGLAESLGKDGVTSNYSPISVQKTFEFLKPVTSGNAIFTQPTTPIKCAGAPQKIMYLAEELFRKNGVRDNVNVIFNTGAPKIFAIEKYANSLTKICADRKIQVNVTTDLAAIDSTKKQATFTRPNAEPLVLPYSFLHVTPPMSAPAFLKESPSPGFTNEAGWVDVDKATTQHTKYPNVFSLGDASSLPTSKTAAAVAAQSSVTSSNLLKVLKEGNGNLPKAYDGYTSCPLVTGRNKLILAEFSGYTGQPQETFPFDQGTESSFAAFVKADVLPSIYWNLMLKGLWQGPGQVRKYLNFGR